jgi:hypothetical protein
LSLRSRYAPDAHEAAAARGALRVIRAATKRHVRALMQQARRAARRSANRQRSPGNMPLCASAAQSVMRHLHAKDVCFEFTLAALTPPIVTPRVFVAILPLFSAMPICQQMLARRLARANGKRCHARAARRAMMPLLLDIVIFAMMPAPLLSPLPLTLMPRCCFLLLLLTS